MRRTLTIAALCFGLAACSSAQIAQFKQDVASMEAQVVAFVQKVKAKIPVVEQDVQTAASLTCSLVSLGQSGVATLQANVAGISDSTQAKINQATVYLNKGAAACQKFNSTLGSAPTPSNGINEVLAAWNAYIAAKAQISSAQSLATSTQ